MMAANIKVIQSVCMFQYTPPYTCTHGTMVADLHMCMCLEHETVMCVWRFFGHHSVNTVLFRFSVLKTDASFQVT